MAKSLTLRYFLVETPCRLQLCVNVFRPEILVDFRKKSVVKSV